MEAVNLSAVVRGAEHIHFIHGANRFLPKARSPRGLHLKDLVTLTFASVSSFEKGGIFSANDPSNLGKNAEV